MDEQTVIIAGIALVVVVDKILSILKTRGIDIHKMSRQMDKVSGQMRQMDDMSRQLDELHRWHAKEDDEGVKVWYVRRSLEDSVKALAESIVRQTDILQGIHREQIALRKEFSTFKNTT